MTGTLACILEAIRLQNLMIIIPAFTLLPFICYLLGVSVLYPHFLEV